MDQSFADEYHTQNVGKGLYSLQAYVYEHWLEHVLSFTSRARGLNDQRVERCMNDLYEVLSEYEVTDGPETNQSEVELYQSATFVERRIKHTEHCGSLYGILCQCVKHRHILKMNFGHDSNDSK
jgi:hypothetical protein